MGGGTTLRDPGDQELQSGHAVAILGYNAGTGFLVADSRGKDFAENGCWWLPFELAQHPCIAQGWALSRLQFLNP
jgi:C1A family cysteine protease